MKGQRRKRKILHPDTVQLVKQILLGVFILLLVAGLVTAIWYGTRVQALTITEVQVSGGETISHEMVESRARAELEGSYLRLVPRRFAFFYPHDAIVASLASIERIKNVQVERTSGTSLAISFDEFVSDALWCSEEGACLFIDSEGYAFAPAPNLQGGAFVRFFTDREVSIGQTVSSVEEYTDIKEIVAELAALGFTTTVVTIDTARDIYLEVLDGGEFKATLTEPPAVTIENLKTVLDSDEFSELAPGTFRYVDLRFGNKVFVNRTPEEEVATTTEESLVEFTIPPEVSEVTEEIVEAEVTEEEVVEEEVIAPATEIETEVATTTATS